MDPVTTAIVAAVVAGVAKTGPDTVGKAVSDAYGALKDVLKAKFGRESKVIKATEELEVNPGSAARKGIVAEEVAGAKADQIAEVLAAAHALLGRLEQLPGGVQNIQMVAGGRYVAQADRGGSATVNVNKRP